ncbi:hypothetical protein AKO1_014680 [Acrasis kona]|uniref:Leukocyte receptor cluster member 1 n=1 Tax=Acrasis kona TaxID=1008807 RepID=A0AAW2Z2Z9_9EUKA
MNLLPTKSWNVWNVDNKQKVAQDEEEHKEKLLAEDQRKRNVQSEKRLELLRQRARAKNGGTNNNVSELNSDEKDNTTHEAASEKHFTLFEDFADDSLGLTDGKKQKHLKSVCSSKKPEDDTLSLGKKKKNREDVAPQGVRFGALPEFQNNKNVPRYHKIMSGSNILKESSDKKRKREEHTEEKPNKKQTPQKSMEQLRNERLQREEKERRRTQALLQKKA